MRWLLLIPLLCAWTPVFTNHDTTDKVDIEFSGQENDVQSKQHTIVTSTPSLKDLKDGEIVIISSGAYTGLMFRSNQEVWAVSVSCITTRR